MSLFEDFVNTELPRRSALLTVEVTGYDGDPNDGGAPAVITGAPKGTWYLRETPASTFYRKNATGTWEEGGSGGGPAGFAPLTQEDFSIPVDYEDPTAMDPPQEIFANQLDVDTWLLDNGANAVKHLDAAYNAIAPLVFHDVTINMAAGVHRPQPGTTFDDGIQLAGKNMLGGSIAILGSEPSTYEVVDAGGAITAHQVSNEVDGGDRNPWVQVAGAGWTPSAFKGLYAVIDTGLTAVIRDNDADKLYLLPELSPEPVDSPTGGFNSVFVGRPSTIIRNSLDDVVREAPGHWFAPAPEGTTQVLMRMQDIRIDDFCTDSNGYASITLSGNATQLMFLTRIFIDKELARQQFGVNPEGRYFQHSSRNLRAYFTHCSCIGDQNFGNTESPWSIFGPTDLYHCFAMGTRQGIAVSGFTELIRFQMTNCVLDQVGRTSRPSIDLYLAQWSFEGFTTFYRGRHNTIVNYTGTVAAMRVYGGSRAYRTNVEVLKFENCDVPYLVRLEGGSKLDWPINSGAERGWRDGGGNTGIGVQVVGANSQLAFSAVDTVAGAGGEIEIEGVLGTWADLPASTSPLVTTRLNVVSRG